MFIGRGGGCIVMFGMEEQKSDEISNFDFEKEFSDPVKKKEITEKIYDKVSLIKTILREGEGCEEFDKIGVILHGYVALKGVIGRIKR